MTDEPSAVERLLETTRFLERTFASLSEAVLVVDDRVIREANRAAEVIFGWPRDELVGRTTEKLHTSRDAYLRFGEESRAVLERGETYRGKLPLRRRDGSAFEAQQTVTLLDPSRGLEGGAVSVVRDVSRQAAAERRVRESEQRFREIAEHVQDVFWVMTPDGRALEYVSPAFERVWGHDPSDLLEDRSLWAESIHPDDRARVLQATTDQSRRGFDEEYRIVTPDGETRWIWDRAFPVRDDSGRVQRVIGVAGDITRRKVLEAQLRQAQKMEAVGRLAGGVAHDFNNLLTVILGQADLLLLDLPEESEWAEEVELMRSAAERGAELTKQLLAFSREQLLRPRVVDAGQVLLSMERLLAKLLGEHVRLTLHIPDALPPVRVDPGQLEQVVVNLAANARDAMPHGGDFRVSAGLEEVDRATVQRWPGLTAGRWVTLTFRDSGSGMDEATRGRIFEPFFTTRRERGGSGLGLATSYGIVKQSGGTIHVESAPGEGTTFLLRLPPVDDDSDHRGRPRDSEAAGAGAG